jgi:peptidoglycan/LPS O-acetylase OafA/YrhL
VEAQQELSTEVNRHAPDHGQGRIDGIDILRGFAIFFVVMLHVHIHLVLDRVHYGRGIPKDALRALVWNGQTGVQMFFAVSGFLITTTSLRRWGTLSKVSLRGFYLMRFARIAPLLLALLAVLSALQCAGIPSVVIPPQQVGLGRALFAALTFHINVLSAHRGYLPGAWDILWSLSVEEMFYLFFPLACILLARRRLMIPLLCLFVVLGPFARTHGNAIWREKSYLGGMDAIALGCLTALLCSRVRFPSKVLRSVGACGAALLVFVLGFGRLVHAWGLDALGLEMTVLAIGTCLVMIAASQSQWRAPRVISPLLDLGQRSYEVYLTHMFIVVALFRLFAGFGEPRLAVPLLFVAAAVLSTWLGDGIARLYSEPMNRMIRQRAKRYLEFERNASPAAQAREQHAN